MTSWLWILIPLALILLIYGLFRRLIWEWDNGQKSKGETQINNSKKRLLRDSTERFKEIK